MRIGLRYEPKETRCPIQTGHVAPIQAIDAPSGYLYDLYPDNCWQGKRCFVIGGGPSLRGFEFSKLIGELVIGTNRVFEHCQCQINLSCDKSFIRNVRHGVEPYGAEAARKYKEFKGVFVWATGKPMEHLGPEVLILLNNQRNKVTFCQQQGLMACGNSGFAAVNLACALGANPIYLLGFDMHGNGMGKQAWFHGGHVNNQREMVYNQFIREFNAHHGEFKQAGFRIVNLNPDSALKCFEFAKPEDIL